jgi:hypothetical protein
VAKSKQSGSGVLADHKKVGKKFIPPFIATLGPIQEVLWVNDLVPELIWLELLNSEHGWHEGTDLARQLAVAAVGARGTKVKSWFALLSQYSNLDVAERGAVIAALQSTGALAQIRGGLSRLSMFYPDFPLSFLYDAPVTPESKDLPVFKEQLAGIFDRWETRGTRVQANAIYIAFVTDMLKVFKGLALANFPAIEEFPATEESKLVAASVRATVSTCYGQFRDERSAEWISYFWRRGLDLEPCSLEE